MQMRRTTKHPGPVKVRHEPPTLEEAIFAAEGLTDDPAQQIEIAATLMNVTPEEVAPLVRRLARRSQEIRPATLGTRTPQRAFVVERKPARRRIGLDRP